MKRITLIIGSKSRTPPLLFTHRPGRDTQANKTDSNEVPNSIKVYFRFMQAIPGQSNVIIAIFGTLILLKVTEPEFVKVFASFSVAKTDWLCQTSCHLRTNKELSLMCHCHVVKVLVHDWTFDADSITGVTSSSFPRCYCRSTASPFRLWRHWPVDGFEHTLYQTKRVCLWVHVACCRLMNPTLDIATPWTSRVEGCFPAHQEGRTEERRNDYQSRCPALLPESTRYRVVRGYIESSVAPVP